MISASHLRKSYSDGNSITHVLKDVSLEVPAGSLTVVLGASGSGKSTLLSVLSGLERADGGSVVCCGEELFSMTEKQRTEFRRKNIGFVFQQYFLLPHLTVEQNVRMGADLSHNRDYRELIRGVGLWEKRGNRPGELSGGEQQRVSIARALAKKPKVLFLDEPTGALDEATGRSVLDYISSLKKELCFTAVMVTHNANIADMADTVIRMNSGTVAETVRHAAPKSAYEIGW